MWIRHVVRGTDKGNIVEAGDILPGLHFRPFSWPLGSVGRHDRDGSPLACLGFLAFLPLWSNVGSMEGGGNNQDGEEGLSAILSAAILGVAFTAKPAV